MKRQLRQTLLVSFLTTLVFAGCSPGHEATETELPSDNDGSSQCVPPSDAGVPEIVKPAQVYVGQKVIFSVARPEAHWKFSLNGATLLFEGENVEVIFPTVGTYLAELKSFDDCGNEENSQFDVSVENLPEGSVVINNGDAFTRNFNVSLKLTVTGATQMRISAGSACSGAWVPFTATTAATLSLSNQENTVSAQFRNASGVESSCVQDKIIHDSQIPVVAITPGPSTLNSATFAFTATDSLSGILNSYCELNGAGFSVCTSPKTFNSGVREGTNTFKAYTVDRAGNISVIKSYAWTVTPPPSSTTTTSTTTTTTTTSTTLRPPIVTTTTTTTLPPSGPPPVVIVPSGPMTYDCGAIVKPAGSFDAKYTAMGDMLRVNPPSYFPYLRDATYSSAPLKSTYNHKNKLTSIPFIVPVSSTRAYNKIDIVQLQPISNNLLSSVTASKKVKIKITPCQNDYRQGHRFGQNFVEDPYLSGACNSAAFNGRIVLEPTTDLIQHMRSGKSTCPIIKGRKYYLNMIVGDYPSTLMGTNPVQNFDCKYSISGNAPDYCGVNLSFEF